MLWEDVKGAHESCGIVLKGGVVVRESGEVLRKGVV